ncbi:MAG TPA: MerR family transcriptional regulator [Kaistia sp.]|jgi:DNA-binding transcriptional MerR regulator|nr:MerR family transcriptional regulator [Kaistia sp.]
MTEFTIRDLASEFGLTLRTLRFWEERKLLKPARRGFERIYTASDRQTVRNIVTWSTAGLSLLEIREVLSMPPAVRRRFLQRRLPEIRTAAEQSYAQLIAAIDDLGAVADATGRRQGRAA